MRKHSWVIIVLFMIQSACAPVRPDHLTQPDKGQLGRVGIVVGDFEPIIALTGSKGWDFAQSTFAGMGFCQGWISLPGGIICLPVGATLGAVLGVVEVGSSNNISIAKGILQANIENLTLQERLRSSLMQYTNSVELKLSPLSQGAGPTTPTDMPDYQFLSDKFDTVVEVVALKLIADTSAFRGGPTSLQLKAKVRVVNTHDGSIMDAFPIISTPWAHWLIDDAKPVQEGIATAIREIAETTINEVLLIYHPTKRIAHNHIVPNYALRPIEPPLRTKYVGKNRVWGNLEKFQLAVLDPTFEWEPFPRGFDIIIGDDSGQAQQVLYDFRIYDMSGIIYERVGLNVTRHKLEKPLQACGSYRWTVRSRFKLNGVPRATEWTGAFNMNTGEIAPWWWRRGAKRFLEKSPANSSYYPSIETPSGISGKKCSEK